MSTSKERIGAVSGPSNCASRNRAADAAEAVQQMAVLMRKMDPEVVRRLVHARNAAAGVRHAFPEGDQRFASVESESDEDAEDETGNGATEGDGGDEGDESDSEEIREPCAGLLDNTMDPGPKACLLRAKRDYGFDIVRSMDSANLEFFPRIRLVNHIRRMVSDGRKPEEVIAKVTEVLTTRDPAVLENDALLNPAIEGDLILTVLESDEVGTSYQTGNNAEVMDAVQSSLQASKIL